MGLFNVLKAAASRYLGGGASSEAVLEATRAQRVAAYTEAGPAIGFEATGSSAYQAAVAASSYRALIGESIVSSIYETVAVFDRWKYVSGPEGMTDAFHTIFDAVWRDNETQELYYQPFTISHDEELDVDDIDDLISDLSQDYEDSELISWSPIAGITSLGESSPFVDLYD